jgi:hypothetical protein
MVNSLNVFMSLNVLNSLNVERHDTFPDHSERTQITQ